MADRPDPALPDRRVPVLRFREQSEDRRDQPAFRRQVRSLTKLAPGAYSDVRGLTAEASHELAARETIARLTQVALSHVSAAVLWDLPMLRRDLSVVHLTTTAGRTGGPRSRGSYRLHPGRLDDASLAVRRGLTVTSAVVTVGDCARLLGTDWGVVLGDAAVRRGLFSRDELVAHAASKRRCHGITSLRRVLPQISPLAESPGETLARVRLTELGWVPQEQVVLDDVEGSPRVDFLIGRWVVVEFDGRSKYELEGSPAAAVWAEKRRHDRIAEAGYEVVRISWSDLSDLPALLARIVRAVNRAQARHGSH